MRTNFRMPDVYSFGLGGGSIVTAEPLRIGPQSVGYELTSKALAFGGTVLGLRHWPCRRAGSLW